MHFCVSDHVSAWLSQIVLNKVHLRWEIEESQPPGEIRGSAPEGVNAKKGWHATSRRRHLQLIARQGAYRTLTGAPRYVRPWRIMA